MGVIAALKSSRERFLDRHSDADDWRAKLFSASTYALWSACRPTMLERCRGRVLDAGSGRGAWRRTILRTAATYESIDLAPRGGDRPTWTGSITAMPDVPDERYDSLVCHQVLEHVRQPAAAIAEFRRVLKGGGTLVLSVPHLSRRHELPHDYFRFTQEGLTALLEDGAFEQISVRPYGGLLSFLHHQASFLVPGVLLGVPVLGTLASLLNAPLSWLAATLDALIDRRGLLALGVLATARKPVAAAGGAP